MNISGVLGQKLIFRPSKSAQDLSYYPTNSQSKYDIRDQHVFFYHSIKTTNGTKTKKNLWIPEGDPRHKKLTYHKIPKKVVGNGQEISG